MRIIYIAAGAAGSYCGACNRDVALIRRLAAMGHDTFMMPLYTPLRTDGPDPSNTEVFYGGINTYLQQHFSLFRKTPAFVDWVFNRPSILRLLSRLAIETRPEELGDMTVSVLRGFEGHQSKEARRLLRFLEDNLRPDIINLSNSLLSAVAPELSRRLGVPVVCTLQGEDVFVMRLREPYRHQAIDLLRQHAQHIDLFFSPAEQYADDMSAFLAVPRNRIKVIRPGVESEMYSGPKINVGGDLRIGFLSRIAPAKGFDILVDAFILVERERPGSTVLCAAGEARGSNADFLKRLQQRIEREGLRGRFEYWGEVELGKKIEFLKRCNVFSIPTRYPEQDGIAYLEAMAAGVPVVAPRIGQLPELLDMTGGGLLVPPDDPEELARAITSLWQDADIAQEMGRNAARVVAKEFSADRMASETVTAYENAMSERPHFTQI